MALDVPASFL